jgi:hypothetical protein
LLGGVAMVWELLAGAAGEVGGGSRLLRLSDSVRKKMNKEQSNLEHPFRTQRLSIIA